MDEVPLHLPCLLMRCESGLIRLVHLSRHKWPGGLVKHLPWSGEGICSISLSLTISLSLWLSLSLVPSLAPTLISYPLFPLSGGDGMSQIGNCSAQRLVICQHALVQGLKVKVGEYRGTSLIRNSSPPEDH